MSWSLAERRLYLCTPLRDDVVEFVTSCVRGGVDVVQLREKERGDAEILEASRPSLARRCAELGVPFLVNDRPDIALDVGADGVHVGQDDLPVRGVPAAPRRRRDRRAVHARRGRARRRAAPSR